MIMIVLMAITTRASYHPRLAINAWVMGEKATIPRDPEAIPSPRTIDRFSGPTTLNMAATAREKATKAPPSPVRMPPVKYNIAVDSDAAIPHRPAVVIRVPATSTSST